MVPNLEKTLKSHRILYVVAYKRILSILFMINVFHVLH